MILQPVICFVQVFVKNLDFVISIMYMLIHASYSSNDAKDIIMAKNFFWLFFFSCVVFE